MNILKFRLEVFSQFDIINTNVSSFFREVFLMTRIPENDRNIMELAFYLPMVLTVLNRDLTTIHNSGFKLKDPYLHWVEETIKVVQSELANIKKYMKQNHLRVQQMNRDDAFTMFSFIYKGYEEHHNYFNPRIRNKVNELMEYYLHKKFLTEKA